MKPIVVVGSINMDLVSRTPRIPQPGETVIGTQFQMFPGGKGANQAVAAARLQHRCFLLGKVGDDVFGETLLAGLRNDGVAVEHVERATGASGIATIAVDAQGENCIIVTPGANYQVDIPYLERHINLLRNAGIVLAQLEIPLPVVEHLALMCNQFRVPLVLDPAPACPLPASLLQRVDWLTPNESEAASLTRGESDPDKILASLAAANVQRVILKCGARGVVLRESTGNTTHIPAFPVDAIDSTAAGDAFNGAFAVALMRGYGSEESVRFASAAAALSVTRHGAQPSMATLPELQHFLNTL